MTAFVEADMNNWNYWKKQTGDCPLANDFEITRINTDIINTEACNMNPIYNIEFINEKVNLWNDDHHRSYCRQHTFELINKFTETHTYSNLINTDMLINEANMYAIVKKRLISLHSIPFADDWGINELIDYFNITDILQNETILVLCSYNNTFYVYTSYGEGWITINPECDLQFIKKDQWIDLYKRTSPNTVLCENHMLEVAFSHLKQRYLWGSAYDCSGYIRCVFNELGLNIPSNTTRQKAMPCIKYDVSDSSIDEKKRILNILPVGSVLYMPGHAALYIGQRNDHYYVINSVGSYYDPHTRYLYKPRLVMINSLDLIRASGETWLESMNMFIIPWLHE